MRRSRSTDDELRKGAKYTDIRGNEWTLRSFLVLDDSGKWWNECEDGTHVSLQRPNPKRPGFFIGKIVKRAAFVKSLAAPPVPS